MRILLVLVLLLGHAAARPPQGPVVRVALDRISLEGTRDPVAVDKVLKQRAGIWRACYQKELNRSPQLRGKLIVAWSIATDGSVSAAVVRQSTVQNAALESCIQSNIRRLRFPAGDTIDKVQYRMLFSSE